jgi:hypothetical protein
MPYTPQTTEFADFETAVKNHSLMKYNYDFEKNRKEVRIAIQTNCKPQLKIRTFPELKIK